MLPAPDAHLSNQEAHPQVIPYIAPCSALLRSKDGSRGYILCVSKGKAFSRLRAYKVWEMIFWYVSLFAEAGDVDMSAITCLAFRARKSQFN